MWMLAALMTGPHLATSPSMKARRSSGVPPAGCMSSVSSCCFAGVAGKVGVDERVELHDDVARRAGRRHHAVGGDRLEAGEAGLAHRRNVGQFLRALRRGDGDAAQRAVLQRAHHPRREVDAEVDLAGDEVGARAGGAAVGHVVHLGAGLLLQQLHGQMRLRADAGDADVEFAGIGFGVGDQFLQVVHRHLGIGREHQRRLPHQDDRREGAVGVERHVLVHEAVGDQHAGRREHQRVAVRLGLGGEGGANVAVGARAVLDHDLLAELRRQRGRDPPGRNVDRAAGAKRHHHGDRPRRPGLREGDRWRNRGEQDVNDAAMERRMRSPSDQLR